MDHLVNRMRGPRALLAPVLVVLLAGLSAGCQGRCEAACRHVLDDCGITELGWERDTCTDLCLDRRDALQDTVAEEAFADELDCLIQSSCEELEASPRACVDEALSPW